MPDRAAVVRVKASPGGVELHAAAGGERFVLALDSAAALTLADQITMACFEGPLRAAA